MGQVIPAEAVEAAAKAGYEYQYSSLEGMWEFANPRVQEDFRREFRAALEAAAPYVAALRQITTMEELEALPNGATLKSLIDGKPIGRVWGKVEGEWWGLAIEGPEFPVLPAELIHLGYPEKNWDDTSYGMLK